MEKEKIEIQVRKNFEFVVVKSLNVIGKVFSIMSLLFLLCGLIVLVKAGELSHIFDNDTGFFMSVQAILIGILGFLSLGLICIIISSLGKTSLYQRAVLESQYSFVCKGKLKEKGVSSESNIL